MAENVKYENDPRPECKYGIKCYQKNPEHSKKFKHPPPTKKLFSIFDVSSRNKRRKLDDSVKTEPIKPSASDGPFDDKNVSDSKDREVKKDNPKKDFQLNKKIFDNEKNAEYTSPKKDFQQDRKSIDKETSIESSSSKKESQRDRKSVDEERSIENSSPKKDFQLDRQSIDKKLNELPKSKILNSEIEYHSSPECIPIFIKEKFLVEMPEDFYSFWELYKSSHLIKSFMESINLKLVGPFDVLSKSLPVLNNDEHYLLHWRFYFDPPEFQTIVASTKNGYHLGYYRDCPSEMPCFVANNDGENPKIVPMGENIFAALISYARSDKPKTFSFAPKKHDEFIDKLKKWASDHKFDTETKTDNMKKRHKNVVASTFHGAGIVVPYNKKTELGYRPLIESDAKIKKILQKLTEATSKESKISAFVDLQPIINMANIATDECDFGTGLELGIDLFCSGDAFLHKSVKRLLSVAYQMLNRDSFETIIEAHLENRRNGFDLSAVNLRYC